MLDLALIRENPEKVKQAIKDKNSSVDLDAVLLLDTKKRALQSEIEMLNHARNQAAHRKDIASGKEIKKKIADIEKDLTATANQLDVLLRKLPNIPSDDTPVGKDENDNKVLRQIGTIPSFQFAIKDHLELGKLNNFIDTEKASQVSGARFSYLKGDLVRLQYALTTYAMTHLMDKIFLEQIIVENNLDIPPTPFIPVLPPLMIRPDVLERMARLDPKEERYHIPSDDLYLIGSAEHTLGPLHMDETLRENDLPLRYMAFTVAFRREAGSYGKDTKGLLRLHQFDKLEMESFSLPEHSLAEQNLMVAIQERFMVELGIPYQVVITCTGDMGDPDARHIDIESWMPSQQKYRETHSADLMTDYQTRRLNTRVRRNIGGHEFVHTNDATAIAGRTLIAIMENFQQADNSIRIPDVLVPFMQGQTVIGGKQ